MFSSISEAKVKEGIFVGPQMRRRLASEELEAQMSDLKGNAWQAFRMIVKGFLGKHRRDDYAIMVSNLIKSLPHVLKVAFFAFSLGFFAKQLGKCKRRAW